MQNMPSFVVPIPPPCPNTAGPGDVLFYPSPSEGEAPFFYLVHSEMRLNPWQTLVFGDIYGVDGEMSEDEDEETVCVSISTEKALMLPSNK